MRAARFQQNSNPRTSAREDAFMLVDLAILFARPRQRRALIVLCLTALAVAQAPLTNAADAYPSRPIRIVVPFAAGNQLDSTARLIADKLADAVGQPVLVENRPGASSNIGSELVANSPPDGYTLLMTGSVLTLLPSTLGSRAIDPVASFTPIIKLGEPFMVIVVHPSLEVNSLPELIALARSGPGKIAYATAGVGTAQHLTAEIIARTAGVEMLHVPYVNSSQTITDVLSGQVPVYFTFLGPINPYLRSAKLKAIAVASQRRIAVWPDVPTVVEAGYAEAAANPWNGVLAPAGTPPEIVDRLYRELARIVQQPDVLEQFVQMGMEPRGTAPDRFAAEIAEAVKRWPPIAREAGIRPE
jgi:tripartite-type tricarboxylate transporter receptor subunit TctC